MRCLLNTLTSDDLTICAPKTQTNTFNGGSQKSIKMEAIKPSWTAVLIGFGPSKTLSQHDQVATRTVNPTKQLLTSSASIIDLYLVLDLLGVVIASTHDGDEN